MVKIGDAVLLHTYSSSKRLPIAENAVANVVQALQFSGVTRHAWNTTCTTVSLVSRRMLGRFTLCLSL